VGRLSPDTFRLPVERMREGYYTDAYFNLTRELLIHEDRRPHVLMQVFQKQESMLGGVDEALAIIRRCAGRHRPDGSWEDGWDALEVRALAEGDRIEPRETVLTIEGDYSLFAHLETLYLGCMARRTLVMRNVNAVVRAARGKPILFFPARHDHWLVQTGDGWAAHVAGAIGVSTDAQASWWGGRGVGTVPTPRPPHQDAFASVDTPIAPASCAAQPSPVCTSQWSWRAGMNRMALPCAASTTARTLRITSVRRARAPRYTVSRWAKRA